MRISAQWRSALSKGARVYKQGSRSIAIRPHPPHHSTIPIRPFSEMASLQPTISASSENGKADTNNNRGGRNGPRNIVILLDGTANQFSSKNSNLIKLMSVLKADETQLLYYSSGLGRWFALSADVDLTPRHGAPCGYEHMEQVEGDDRRGDGHGVCLVSRHHLLLGSRPAPGFEVSHRFNATFHPPEGSALNAGTLRRLSATRTSSWSTTTRQETRSTSLDSHAGPTQPAPWPG